ncbi:MAG TPA: hypothetical protein VMU16_09535 [Candidatus Binataceae bacterium]|nr:hypothetical protein [Candidatus Binataceae bacterium]
MPRSHHFGNRILVLPSLANARWHRQNNERAQAGDARPTRRERGTIGSRTGFAFAPLAARRRVELSRLMVRQEAATASAMLALVDRSSCRPSGPALCAIALAFEPFDARNG